MPYKVKFKSKSSVDGASSIACWCYEIETTVGEFKKDSHVGLDFVEEIPISDPAHYEECNDYFVNAEGVNGTPEGKQIVGKKVREASNTVKLCFIATSEERAEVKISLHSTRENESEWSSPFEFEGSGWVVGSILPRLGTR